MFLTSVIIILTMVVLSVPEIIHNVSKNLEASDFSEIVRRKYFVDKTLLLKDLLIELRKIKNDTKCHFLKVLSQPKYGKSTNLNMIKRFFGICVDENGTRTEVNKSDNFLIFSNNSLNVYKDKDFFHNSFGAYPVILIDFKPLCKVKTFEDLLNHLRGILKTTFIDHRYLLRASGLWDQHFHKNSFQVFFDDKTLKRLQEYSLFCSFSILSKILYSYFKKRVIVLVDDFDSFQESAAYNDYSLKSEKKKITTYMGILYSDLLVSNKFLYGALLSGSSSLGKLYLKKVSHSEKPYTDITDASESHNNTLWKYFGLSKNELRLLLSRLIHDPNKVKDVECSILQDHTNHNTTNNVHMPFSVWSVMNYLESYQTFIS